MTDDGFQRLELGFVPPGSDASTVVVLGGPVVVAIAKTKGVPLFERRLPMHTVLLGRGRVEVEGSVLSAHALPIAANTPHQLMQLDDTFAGGVYLDPRHFAVEDVRRLAEGWRPFAPGRDDPKDLVPEALSVAHDRLDVRLHRALAVLEQGGDVAAAADAIDLSESRLTHLVTQTLGAPPRAWKMWFKLQAALGHVMLHGANLTEAAHHAGFADSAHLTRTCKQLTGLRPAMMLPRTIYVATPPGAQAPRTVGPTGTP